MVTALLLIAFAAALVAMAFELREPLFKNLIAMPLGWRQDSKKPFVMTERHLAFHQLILGTTGSGKSRLAAQQCRYLMDCLRGFCYIDPDGDTVEDLLAYAIKKSKDEGTDAIIKQLVYIELNYGTVFGIDVFAPPDFSHLPPELQENAYRAWLSVKVDFFSEMVQNHQGASDFAGMARLQRTLRTVLYAVGTSIDRQGRHLPLSEVFALLDCDHQRHDEVYGLVRNHLPDDVRSEFERWRGADRRQRLLETESTLNRLRSLLSPLVMAMFTEPARRINFRQLVDQRKIVLVNLRQSDFLSADQQRAVGTMFIHEIWTACKVKEREGRTAVAYYLYVDESHVYLNTAGSDLLSILERGRKYKVSLTLIGQFLGQFKNERVDMIPAVLNLCRSFACFLQMNPDDLDILKRYFGYPNLNFEELFQVVDRPDGYELIKLIDYARSYTSGQNWTQSTSVEQSKSSSTSATKAESDVSGTSTAHGQQTSEGQSTTTNNGRSEHRDLHERKLDGSVTKGNAVGKSTGSARSEVNAETKSHSVTTSTGTTDGTTRGTSASQGEGGNAAASVTESQKTSVLGKTREEWHPTGKLRHAVEDQFHYVAHRISSLKDRQAMVRLYGEQRTFMFDVGDVPDVFPDPVEMARAIEDFKERIFRHHPFYFVPDLSPSAQANRLEEWLGQHGPDEPQFVERERGEQEIPENPLDG